MTIGAGAVQNASTTDSSGATVAGAQNVSTTQSFTVEGPTATIANPGDGGTIDVNVINGRNWIDVVFDEPTCTTAPCVTINQGSITTTTPKFSLGGPGLGTLALDTTQAPVLVGSEKDGNNNLTTLTYRFWLTGQAAQTCPAGQATPCAVTLTFLPNSWSYFLNQLPTTITIADRHRHERARARSS